VAVDSGDDQESEWVILTQLAARDCGAGGVQRGLCLGRQLDRQGHAGQDDDIVEEEHWERLDGHAGGT
jgi:hypothetical protein